MPDPMMGMSFQFFRFRNSSGMRALDVRYSLVARDGTVGEEVTVGDVRQGEGVERVDTRGTSAVGIRVRFGMLVFDPPPNPMRPSFAKKSKSGAKPAAKPTSNLVGPSHLVTVEYDASPPEVPFDMVLQEVGLLPVNGEYTVAANGSGDAAVHLSADGAYGNMVQRRFYTARPGDF